MTNKQIRELVESVKTTNGFDRVDNRVYRLQSYISKYEDGVTVLVTILLKNWKALTIATATATQSTIQKAPLNYRFRKVLVKNATAQDLTMIDKFITSIQPNENQTITNIITTAQAIDIRRDLVAHKALNIYNI